VAVVAVGDGEQAIARIPGERPDVVLADIGMPKRSGYEVSAFVKGHPELRHIPVLLLAGAFEPVDEARAEQSGCDGVLVKPFEPQHVVARVRELLDGVKGSPTQAAAADVARPVERLSRPSDAPPPHRPAAAVPASPAPPPKPAEPSLDDYFDRLDAAFATLGTSPPGPAEPSPDIDVRLPTLDAVLAAPPVQPPPMEPADASPTLSAAPAPVANAAPAAVAADPRRIDESPRPAETAAPAASPAAPAAARKTDAAESRNVIADVFRMMLEAEQGDRTAPAVRLTLGQPEPTISDEMIDEVVRRVLQKLAPDATRAVVVQVVSEVAERLVRAEIARIRGTN
jgi:CheY-like chemotaxis protein